MGSSRTLIAHNSFSSQATVILRLPDIPGQIVEVRKVIAQVQSLTSSSSCSHALYHNVDVSSVLAINDVESQWLHLETAVILDQSPASFAFVDFAVPYELVGPQRWEMVPSAGTINAILTVIYTVRSEPNRTLWNEVRNRTSFEKATPL